LADKSREPIRTGDIDLMVNPGLPVIGSKTVDQLLVEAGFQPNFKGREIHPVICYEGNIDGHEVEIEFITDQRGAKEDVVLEVNFSSLTSNGVLLLLSQRPSADFPNLDDEQFKQYVLGTFQEFIGEIKSF